MSTKDLRNCVVEALLQTNPGSAVHMVQAIIEGMPTPSQHQPGAQLKVMCDVLGLLLNVTHQCDAMCRICGAAAVLQRLRSMLCYACRILVGGRSEQMEQKDITSVTTSLLCLLINIVEQNADAARRLAVVDCAPVTLKEELSGTPAGKGLVACTAPTRVSSAEAVNTKPTGADAFNPSSTRKILDCDFQYGDAELLLLASSSSSSGQPRAKRVSQPAQGAPASRQHRRRLSSQAVPWQSSRKRASAAAFDQCPVQKPCSDDSRTCGPPAQVICSL